MPDKRTAADILEELAAPFSKKDIQYRVLRHWSRGKNGYSVLLATYVTNRAIQTRLDGVMGIDGWKNEFKDMNGGILCGLSLRIDGEWITRWDGAEPTHVEPFKGGLSDAMKRAASQWGIGRYLYRLGEQYAFVRKNKPEKNTEGWQPLYEGKGDSRKLIAWWLPKPLPNWALPENERKERVPEMHSLYEDIGVDDGIEEEVIETITEGQALDLISIAEEHRLTEKDVLKVVRRDFGKESLNYLSKPEYEKIVKRIQAKQDTA